MELSMRRACSRAIDGLQASTRTHKETRTHSLPSARDQIVWATGASPLLSDRAAQVGKLGTRTPLGSLGFS